MTPPNSDQILSLVRTGIKGLGFWLITEGLHATDNTRFLALLITGAVILLAGCWFSWKTHANPDA